MNRWRQIVILISLDFVFMLWRGHSRKKLHYHNRVLSSRFHDWTVDPKTRSLNLWVFINQIHTKKKKKKSSDALRDLAPFVDQPAIWHQPATLLKVALFHRCFSRFLNCSNGTKSHNSCSFGKIGFFSNIFKIHKVIWSTSINVPLTYTKFNICLSFWFRLSPERFSNDSEAFLNYSELLSQVD